MPKMTRWDNPEPVEVSGEKVAVYAAQGWRVVNEKPRKVQPAVIREVVDEPAPVAKKAPAKRSVKKSAKKA